MIIQREPNPSGAYPAPQTWENPNIPEGYAPIADSVDMTDFYEYNGFVTLTIEESQHTKQVEIVVPVEKTREVEGTIINEQGKEETRIVTETYWEEETQMVDETYTTEEVTGYTPNVEAWEAWKNSLPEPEPEPPTTEERIAALEEQVQQADETAIELYEMQMAQEEINAAQDDALIEIYEMIGG